MTSVSLGFSCQTRLSIDEVSADHRSLPFDFVVVTRQALLEALRTRGASFWPDADSLSVFTMPKEGREGAVANGLAFWHDYPMDGRRLAANWRDGAGEVADKYRFLWSRLERLLPGPAPKRIVLSNTQSNLDEYAPDGSFAARFGLTTGFYRELTEALDAFGARNYEVMFLNRSLTDTLDTRGAIADPRFVTRFGGVLELPTNARFAVSALGGVMSDPGYIDRACGRFDDGWSVERSDATTAIAYRDTGAGPEPAGELSASQDGLLAVFIDAPGNVMRVVEEDGDLYFAMGSWGAKIRWRRIGA